MLKARLYELELQRLEEAANDAAANKTEIGWGNQFGLMYCILTKW